MRAPDVCGGILVEEYAFIASQFNGCACYLRVNGTAVLGRVQRKLNRTVFRNQ